MLWGNMTLEAAACNSLIIGNKLHMNHLIIPECDISSLSRLNEL